MNDPGEPISMDSMIPGVPSRRLVFAAVGDHSAALVYGQGGSTDTLNAPVFSYANDGGAWAAIADDRSIDRVSALRTAVRNGRFRNFER